MKLSEDQKKLILELKQNGLSSRKIAKEVLGRDTRKSTVNDFLSRLSVDKEIVNPRILFFDIETTPMRSYVWGRYKQNIYQPYVLSESYILTYSAKWIDGDDVMFGYINPEEVAHENDSRIVKELIDLFNEADIVVGHNSDRFDIPIVKTRALYNGIAPPKPFRSYDTLKAVKRNFRFSSNKLNDVCEYLGIGSKHDDGGFETWKGYMDGDETAINTMVYYNIGDVDLLYNLYMFIRGFDRLHPNVGVYHHHSFTPICPCCGSENITKTEKFIYTNLSAFEAYHCDDCGKWFRGRKNVIENREKLFGGA